ncbi:MAG TPA: 5-oxoprolinase subunit PxpB [Bacillota bacterium]|nr:5-oxoprolinase subunit PxpB [Bacillota bacterium]
MELFPLGESAIIVEFGKGIHLDIHRKVKRLTEYLDRYPFVGMIECVPAFSSVTVFYNPVKVKQENKEKGNRTSFEMVSSMLNQMALNIEESANQKPRTVEIPVCYGGDFGPDLEFVAEHNKLTLSDVIEIHSSREYLVYMIGFAPGFPYLGGMSERISAPRRSSPRMKIPGGSVGIAGTQTGIYPISTPGGWQLIGRTPLDLFCPDESPPSLLQSGDLIRFQPISRKEFDEYRGGSW